MRTKQKSAFADRKMLGRAMKDSTTRLSVFMPGAGDILPFETDLSVQSHETLQLVNVDEAQLQIYAPNLSAQDKQALKDGTGCLVKNPIAFSYGAVFGYVCCIFVGAAQTDALQLVAVPVMAIVEAAIISIVACLLATAIPLRSIARMSIVDSIETVE